MHYLKAEFDRVQVDRVWTFDVSKALSEGVHSNLLPLSEGVCNVSPPDALDTEMGELHRHLVVVDVHGADSLLAAVPPHAGRAHQVVRMRLRHLRVVRHAAAEE